MEIFWQTTWFAEIVQWVTFAILLILVFSPFIVISIKRFNLAKWYVVPFVYLVSWFIHSPLNAYLIDFVTKPLARLEGFTDIVFAIEDGYFNSSYWLFIFWPLSIFYVIKLLQGKFTLKNILIGLGLAVVIFIFLLGYLFYGISQGWGFEYLLKSF